MKFESVLAESAISILVHGVFLFLILILAYVHPDYVAYAAGGFAALSLSFATYAYKLRQKHLQEQEMRMLAEGLKYKGGELEAINDIKQDIRKLGAGSTVTICGTGVTAIIAIADEVYQALKRGVDFEVYVLHPDDNLVERLADMELDIGRVVADPMINDLGHKSHLRLILNPEWCDKAISMLKTGDGACSLHLDGHAKHSLHGRVICTSAEAWKQVDNQLERTDPRTRHGHVFLNGYRTIPIIKAWRFRTHSSEVSEWYYIADHIYHTGVGVDNPMRRVNKPPLDSEESFPGADTINLKNIDAEIERIKNVSSPL